MAFHVSPVIVRLLGVCMVATTVLAAEFALEAAGALLSFRRRNWLVFFFFLFLFLSDIGVHALKLAVGGDVYGWACWGQRAGKHLFLVVLACVICAKLIRDNSNMRLNAAILSIVGVGFVALAYSRGETVADSLLNAEIAANIFLWLLVVIGWLSQTGKLEAPWNWIAAGFLTQIASDIVITALWMKWAGAPHWYPVGVIPAYGLMVCGLWACAKQSMVSTLPACQSCGNPSALDVNLMALRCSNGHKHLVNPSPEPVASEASSEVEGLALFSNYDAELLRKWRIRA